ncbi:unnamed protein product [Adineta steineri]|uniref:Uncharacterized protein n=1 Tax=Adineta steineri TaxID=433720 RepID=A0A813S8K7_9BILA|nr:unnamed protein product [Adineta steineri]CAF1279477.1 unnamed protein product [Adineta steineri]CAF3740134.1 unnamed protein product [Adineta steineri]CAF3964424.1 unnamed protein product [Adineta steineri]
MMNRFLHHTFLLFLLIFPNNINTFSCINDDTIVRYKFPTLDFDAFEREIKSLGVESQGYGAMCKVQMYKAYDDLTIWFEQCFIGYENKAACPDGHCSGSFWSNSTKYEFQCVGEYPSGKQIFIETFYIPVTLNIDKNMNTYHEIQSIKYICGYTLCNSRNNTDKILNIIKQQYDLSPIRNVLNYTYKESTTTPKPLHTTKPTPAILTSPISTTSFVMNTVLENSESSANLFLSTSTDVLSTVAITTQVSTVNLQVESTVTVSTSSNLETTIKVLSRPINSIQDQTSAIKEVTRLTENSKLSTTTTLQAYSSGERFSISIYLLGWVTITIFLPICNN